MKKQTKKDKAFMAKAGTLWIKPGLKKKGEGGPGFTEKEKAFAQNLANAMNCPVLAAKVSAGLVRPERKQQEDSFSA